jgi:hypothetical protein
VPARTAPILHEVAREGGNRPKTTTQRGPQEQAKHLQIHLNTTAWPPNRADAHPLTMEVLYQLS